MRVIKIKQLQLVFMIALITFFIFGLLNNSFAIPLEAIEWPISEGGNGHYYMAVLVPEGITWDDAFTATTEVGGYLATITSQEENDFVYSLIIDKYAFWYIDDYGNSEGPWLGGHQPPCSPEPWCGWRWVTEEPFNYTNWGPYSPNNWGGDESRLCFFGYRTDEGGPQWNYVHNSSHLLGYIVEFSDFPGIWIDTGSMEITRRSHTATLLPNGKVLIAGGFNATSKYLSSAELYDPATGSFSPTGSMGTNRSNHTATLLPNGKVLITGGYYTHASAELYNPATGSFSFTGSMGTARARQTATLLQNGKVLITGGIDFNYKFLSSAEVYDPATGTFTPTGSMGKPRISHTATLLPNGNVLITGGQTYFIPIGDYLSLVELYDPATGSFSPTGSMGYDRADHTATLLTNGNVLVTGGEGSRYRDSEELYDLSNGTFSYTAGSMGRVRIDHSATLLPNGKVLVSGGYGNFTLASAELYDPSKGTFSFTGAMKTSRAEHSATLLPNGKVLVVGGETIDLNVEDELATAELYTTIEVSTWRLGDINNDSQVDISDVILVLRIALVIDSQVPCSDINNDKSVDISDVILTLRMALGIDPIKQCTE